MHIPSTRLSAALGVFAIALLLASAAAVPLRSFFAPEDFEGSDVREEAARARRAFVDSTEAWDVVEHKGLHRAPLHSDLLRADALLPRSGEAPLRDLQWLYRAAQSCALAQRRADDIHPALRKALRWHRFLCDNEAAPDLAFFSEPPLLHPGGGTFAAAALRSQKAPFTDPQWQRSLTPWLHVRERGALVASPSQQHFLSWFGGLSEEESIAFLEGARTLVSKTHVVLAVEDARGNTTRVYTREAWEDFFRGRTLVPLVHTRRSQTKSDPEQEHSKGNRGTPGPACLLQEDTVCWTLGGLTAERRAAQTLLAGSALFGVLVAAGFALVSFLERERRNGEQIFMLRTLSHELRTPLTAMTLASETLRERFDALDERGQRDLLVMLAETQKLARVVRGSGQALLSAAQGRSGIQSLACVIEVVEAALEPFETKIHTTLPEGPIPFCTDPFWLGLCVSNLVRNAVIHGKPPVRTTLTVNEKILIFSVEDTGTFEGFPGTRFAPFRRGTKSAGLGLGLSLVARKARDLGGKLEVRTCPTVFTLTLRNQT